MEVMMLAVALQMPAIVLPISIGAIIALIVPYWVLSIAIECIGAASRGIARSRPSRRGRPRR